MTIKINFPGGIISPGELYNILVAVQKLRITEVSFGLRQQLLIQVDQAFAEALMVELRSLNVHFQAREDECPNIVSSYPAEEIFITPGWLSEGAYKDILDLVDFHPRLKINISNSNQSFTPLLTGNINWVASGEAQHFWHLFIRFPKTNTIYEWKEMVYTNDVARMSMDIEELIFHHRQQFYDNALANGAELFKLVQTKNYITRKADSPARLPPFNLPYYEGLNRYRDKYWLGVYRRDELFPVDFLKEVCQLCLHTRIGQICSTPWKSIIVKNIEEKDRGYWNSLLANHRINVRHAANELNFQVEDNCQEGLELKDYLVKGFHADDMRTFGICVGIKTRRKSEVFSSILVRKRQWIKFAGRSVFSVYDILCAKDFNPNERTGTVFSKGIVKFLLREQLRRAILSFYNHHQTLPASLPKTPGIKKQLPGTKLRHTGLHQCRHCLSVYDENAGEPVKGIAAGTGFDQLPADYHCELCEAPKPDFVKLEPGQLVLQPA
jgi:rubredoxin